MAEPARKRTREEPLPNLSNLTWRGQPPAEVDLRVDLLHSGCDGFAIDELRREIGELGLSQFCGDGGIRELMWLVMNKLPVYWDLVVVARRLDTHECVGLSFVSMPTFEDFKDMVPKTGSIPDNGYFKVEVACTAGSLAKDSGRRLAGVQRIMLHKLAVFIDHEFCERYAQQVMDSEAEDDDTMVRLLPLQHKFTARRACHFKLVSKPSAEEAWIKLGFTLEDLPMGASPGTAREGERPVFPFADRAPPDILYRVALR